MEISYIGENLIPGYLGYISVALSFSAALLAFIAYIFFTNNPAQKSWKKIARIGFYFHAIGVLGIIGALFYLIYNHQFQYYYVWAHASLELPVHYMISCFWEGQEGSFLLWTFWHMIIGLILIRVAGKWEGPVLSIIALAQITLSSMLLGLEIFGWKIGSNPFILLRDVFPEEGIFQLANYVPLIEDGTGLNPLLQNYWMVIHPPVLFVGFAAMIVPFAYAFGGLWTRQYKEWIAPALPWTIFSVLSLGTGILMGGAWAYETLNFGGYWAWDPVENASLVPWILMIAAIHTMLIFKKSGEAVMTTFLLVIFGFISVLYATFLTRSGVLGETSVHSFTDLGLSGQLLFFIGVFFVSAILMLIVRRKELPVSDKEEKIYSREFWMFIGALILSLSAFQVIFSTSIPVMNHLPFLNIAPPADPIAHYNKFQLPFAIVIGLLTGFAQFFKYKNTKIEFFLKNLFVTFVISLFLAAALIYYTDLRNWAYMIMLFACVFTVTGNFGILFSFIGNKKTILSGAAVSHIGFGLLLLGALLSSAKQEVVSHNIMNIDYGGQFDEQSRRENIMLIKDTPVPMYKYIVTFRGDSTVAPNTYYRVEYRKLNPERDKIIERFELFPYAQINPNMGLVSSPDTRHYLLQDIYTHVTSIPDKESDDYIPEYGRPDTLIVQLGDTILRKRLHIRVLDVELAMGDERIPFDDYEIATNLLISVDLKDRDRTYYLKPLMVIRGNGVYSFKDEIQELGIKVRFLNVFPETNNFQIELTTGDAIPDYIIMKAIKFPFINVLWLGMLILVIGFTIAIVQRSKEYNRSKWKEKNHE